MELLQRIDFVFVVMVVGSLLGSIKSTLETNQEVSKCVKGFNILLGMFCGMSVAHIFHAELEAGYIGLIALVSAMVGTNILEVISELAPDIAKKYIKTKIK